MGSIDMEALSSLVRAAQGGDLEAFDVAEAYTEIPGEYVRVEDTVKGFKELLEGHYEDLPDQAFYFVGGVAEVIAKAGKE